MARTGKASLKSAIIIIRLYQLEIDATNIYRETCISQVYKHGCLKLQVQTEKLVGAVGRSSLGIGGECLVHCTAFGDGRWNSSAQTILLSSSWAV